MNKVHSKEKLVFVKDLMWKKVDFVDGLSSVRTCLNKMKNKSTKMLVVHKKHKYDEHGIVLISNIARDVIAKNRSLDRVNAYEVMTKPAIHVHPDMQIHHCAMLLANFKLSRCPVVKKGEVVGVISLTGIVFNGLDKL